VLFIATIFSSLHAFSAKQILPVAVKFDGITAGAIRLYSTHRPPSGTFDDSTTVVVYETPATCMEQEAGRGAKSIFKELVEAR
jgi:hypothetical protein